MQRLVFSRQPAHVILVDVRPPFNKETCNNLTTAMEQFSSIVCSVSGPCRVPFLGLLALGTYPETLFPLQPMRGNFGRLRTALSDLRQFQQSSSCSAAGCVAEGLQETVCMFHKHAQRIKQTAGYFAQLEVTIFTSKSVIPVVKQLEKVVMELNLDKLKKVQVVCLSNPEPLTSLDDVSLGSSIHSSPTGSQGGGGGSGTSDGGKSSSGDSAGMVDYLTIEGDSLNLENFFKGWLHDCATESEHMQIVLPPAEKTESEAEPLTLRCDLHERMLNPALLPFHGYFSIQLEAQGSKQLSPSGARGLALGLPVHRLSALQRIPVNSICESVLFGQPLIVRATSCWKLDWDVLESNKQQFHALCSLLAKQNEALLACFEEEATPKLAATTCGRLRYPSPTHRLPHPQGHFLFLPSPQTGTLLLKSIAVSEVTLPVEVCVLESPNQRNTTTVEAALKQLPTGDSFNPLLMKSGLYDSLCLHLTKSLPSTVQQPGNKRKILNTKLLTGIGNYSQGHSWDSSCREGEGNTGPFWDTATSSGGKSKKSRQSHRLGAYNAPTSTTPHAFPTEL